MPATAFDTTWDATRAQPGAFGILNFFAGGTQALQAGFGVTPSKVIQTAYEPVQLAEALGGLLRVPPPLDLGHMARAHVTVEMRLTHLREILTRSSRFSFDEAVKGADRLTEAMTLW